MELHQLRAFVTIAEMNNLTRASEALYTSQSAVSAQIKALENELGVQLFDRKARGMVLTEAGKILLEEATSAMAAARRVVEKAASLNEGSVSGHWKIRTVAEPAILRLGEFSTRLLARYPNLRLSFTQGISGDVIEQVANEKCNAGYIIGETHDSRLGSVPISPIKLRIVSPAQWRDKIADADWSDIAELPWISTPESCSFRSIATHMFQSHGVSPRSVIEADQEVALRELVTSGVGLTLLREDIAHAAEIRDELVVWDKHVEVTTINFIYPRVIEGSPAAQAILEVLKEVWNL